MVPPPVRVNRVVFLGHAVVALTTVIEPAAVWQNVNDVMAVDGIVTGAVAAVATAPVAKRSPKAASRARRILCGVRMRGRYSPRTILVCRDAPNVRL